MRPLQKEIIEFEKTLPEIEPATEIRRSVDFLKNYLKQNKGLKTLVLGISGGQDSTLAGKLSEITMTELREETGCVADNMVYLGDSYESPYVNTVNQVFLAEGCRPVEEAVLDGLEAEQGTKFVLVSPDELWELARRGEICNSGVLFLALKYLDHSNGNEIKNLSDS